MIFSFVRLLTHLLKKNYGRYTIGPNLCMVWRGRLKSKAFKYDSEDGV